MRMGAGAASLPPPQGTGLMPLPPGAFAPPQGLAMGSGGPPIPPQNAYDQAVLADNPKAWYKLAANADDSSGNGYNGTAQSGVTFGVTAPDGFGFAALASGAATSGAVTLPSAVDFTGWTGATWEAWVARRDLATSTGQLQVWYTPNANLFSTNSGLIIGVGYIGGSEPNDWAVRIGTGSSSPGPSPFQWAVGSGLHHFVVTVDANAMIGYVDGAVAFSQGGVSSLAMGSAPLALNTLGGGNTSTIPDLFAQQAMYSGALTAARVSAHYQAGMPTPAAPTNAFASAVLALAPDYYWPLSDPTAAQVFDYAGGYNTGFGQGAPTANIGVAPTTAGPFPGVGAMQFTASADGWIATTVPHGTLTDYTIIVAFATTATAGTLFQTSTPQYSTTPNGAPILFLNGDLLSFGVNSGVYASTAAAVNDGTIHLAVATMTATTGMMLYLDGVAVGSNTTVATGSAGWWMLGGLGNWVNNPSVWNGTMAQVAVVESAALTSADVANLWTAWQASA